MTRNDRMNWDFIIDVLDVLERHGYHQHDNQHTGQAIAVISDLAQVYEGTRDVPYGTYLDHAPPATHPEPGQPVRQADPDAVILTSTDVSTVLAALDLAGDNKRDRAEMCADCANQSCLSCQSRLQDAQAYDRLAAQMHRTAQAGRAAHASQPEPGSPGSPPGQADPVADKEAGQ
jgi:hypothetical protein